MKEGSLDAPIRHAVQWQDENFYSTDKLDEELRRVFDVCHGCRRCFNLCDSFPKLFDLIDESDSGELDTVASADFEPIVDACTLCDMCYLTKCPYVPPHEFNIDFPHLMLRYRAVQFRNGQTPFVNKELTKTDRNGKAFGKIASIVNWGSNVENSIPRKLLETTCNVHRDASLPKFHKQAFLETNKNREKSVNSKAPGYGRKAVVYATCFVNYNNPSIGTSALNVLNTNGVETEVVYPSCCGMPQLEQGNIADVARAAEKVAKELRIWVDKGNDIIALTPSCALMLKFEWPLILPDNEDVKVLSSATYDIDEYIVEIAKKEGLVDGLKPLDGGITLHHACHSRAQNFGQKSVEMLKFIPDVDLTVIERCSGHGGSWGMMKDNYETALKVGKPAARQAKNASSTYVASGCPLAAEHILQGMEALDGNKPNVEKATHPIELLAKAYGF
ncbi:MAG: glycerol-3-phosphate dehydrogenase [Rhodospirillaceae bacterium]|nr:glycerol-3-phosphate dehydrogenase [Rhodospirillaceae bacterium]